MNKIAKAQIKYLELLKENNLLDLALEGKLPPHVEQAAKQAVILEMTGAKVNDEKTTLQVSAEEHDEAQREIDEYLNHYKISRDLHSALNQPKPRQFMKKRNYEVKSGYFEGKLVTYKGTDKEVFGTDWLSNFGHPACEKFLFRAQRDRLNLKGRILVFHLPSEARDILLHENEVGAIIQ